MLDEMPEVSWSAVIFFPGAIAEKDSEYIELSDEVKVCYDNERHHVIRERTNE